MKTLRYSFAVVAALALSLTAVSPASGRVIEHQHFTFTDSHIEQEEHGDEFCPNVEFLVLYEIEARGMALVKTKGSSPFPYFAEVIKTDETYTNLENGKTLRFLSVARNGDQSIVDNGDGTITLTFKRVARVQVFGPDGTKLFVDSGQFRAELVIDYNGTPANPDDDEEVSFEVTKDVGHRGTADRDFCEDLVTFLG